MSPWSDGPLMDEASGSFVYFTIRYSMARRCRPRRRAWRQIEGWSVATRSGSAFALHLTSEAEYLPRTVPGSPPCPGDWTRREAGCRHRKPRPLLGSSADRQRTPTAWRLSIMLDSTTSASDHAARHSITLAATSGHFPPDGGRPFAGRTFRRRSPSVVLGRDAL